MVTQTKTNDPTELFENVIHSYTRAQAIEDGVLIDVTEAAREAGFSCPVAITDGAWADAVAWNEQDSERQTYQDEAGRLWDVLWMALVGIKLSERNGTQLLFPFYRLKRDGHSKQAVNTRLKLISGPGDDGELVITIMLPQED